MLILQIVSLERHSLLQIKDTVIFYHVTLLINTPANVAQGKNISTTINASNAQNITTKTAGGVSIFTDTTGELSNGAHTGEIANCAPSYNVTGNSAVMTVSANLGSKPTTPFIKIPLVVGVSTIPASFTIDSVLVTYDGEEQDVLEIGGFFTEEKYEIK